MAVTVMSDDIVTKPMNEAAKAGLTSCHRCIEKLATFDALGFPLPDVRGIVEDWKPRFEAVIEQYAQQQAGKHGQRT